MKKLIFTTSLFTMVLLVLQVQAKDGNVLLSQISDELKPYQGSEMDYIKDTILYSNIDRANYDQYFKMCAEGFATMVQLNTTIVKLNEGELSKDDEFVKATLVFAARRMAGLEAELKRIEALDKTLDPENDFKGIEKRKQPGAIKGLVRSRWQLMNSFAMYVTITENLTQLAQKKDE